MQGSDTRIRPAQYYYNYEQLVTEQREARLKMHERSTGSQGKGGHEEYKREHFGCCMRPLLREKIG